MSRAQVVGGATYLSAYLESPGLVVHAGGLTQMEIGGAGDIVVEALRAACDRVSGLDARTVQDIDPVLWDKFVTISAFSGGTSLMRTGIGFIFADREARIFIEQLRDEGMAVASAAGHPMDDDFKQRVIARWMKLPPETRSSMANDLAQGKPLELASANSAPPNKTKNWFGVTAAGKRKPRAGGVPAGPCFFDSRACSIMVGAERRGGRSCSDSATPPCSDNATPPERFRRKRPAVAAPPVLALMPLSDVDAVVRRSRTCARNNSAPAGFNVIDKVTA